MYCDGGGGFCSMKKMDSRTESGCAVCLFRSRVFNCDISWLFWAYGANNSCFGGGLLTVLIEACLIHVTGLG